MSTPANILIFDHDIKLKKVLSYFIELDYLKKKI